MFTVDIFLIFHLYSYLIIYWLLMKTTDILFLVLTQIQAYPFLCIAYQNCVINWQTVLYSYQYIDNFNIPLYPFLALSFPYPLQRNTTMSYWLYCQTSLNSCDMLYSYCCWFLSRLWAVGFLIIKTKRTKYKIFIIIE